MKKIEIIKLSRSNDVKPLREAPEKLTIVDFGISESETPVLYIKADCGNYATNSKVFIETFAQSIEALDEERASRVIGIKVKSSKAGRVYRVAYPVA